MQFSVAERVAGLIDEVSRIEQSSESSYLTVARLFPAIMAEMDRSGRNASASLDGFNKFTGSASSTGLRSMAAFAEESGAYFKAVHERDAGFLVRINESIERLTSLEDVIGRVRSDSEEMEIISLNAMTVALKSGNAGKAFSVITDELKRLSSSTIGLTETITGRGRDLMDCFSGLRDSLRELDAFQEVFFGDLDRALSTGYQGLEADIREATGFFGQLLTEARDVKEPILAIMQGVQLQDIIRQSLQHVTISLKEARQTALDVDGGAESFDPREELAFVSAVSELASSLLADVIAKVKEGSEALELQIAAVSFIVEGVEDRRRDFVKKLSYATGDPKSSGHRVSMGSSDYLELKKKVIHTARRLADQVRGLDESFKGLAGLLSRFQNIVVASRIEVAKNRALAGVANTVQGMIQLTDRIGVDVGEATDTTKDFIKVSWSAIAEYSGEGEGSSSFSHSRLGRPESSRRRKEGEELEGDRLVSTLGKVESDIESLDSARAGVGEAIANFLLYTPEFISLISEAQAEVKNMLELAAKLASLEAEVGSLRASIRAEIGEEISTTNIKSERLRSMIDRFTIFTHKKTAGQIGSFEVEDGVGAGEVTLF
jgi:hypothetical protein